ncbi:uncharacterized protein LOC132382214 isoform X11 [Hypanus sabinus]|uniref:uncharacterized protein LOC132382214 isoform X11 n=1 Tax=Hypanus sabinus TaxID=79690 RepID=UPI0028C441EA|nr:uncharacterized protein LOC132382214 isoform X11 [Hypanus sabinus]
MQEEDRSRRFSEAIRDCCLFCPHRDGRGEWQRLVGPVSGARGFDMSHTILLVQPTKRPEGRTYADYESVNECMEDIEQILRHTNPTTRTGSRRKSMSCCGDKPSNQEIELGLHLSRLDTRISDAKKTKGSEVPKMEVNENPCAELHSR